MKERPKHLCRACYVSLRGVIKRLPTRNECLMQYDISYTSTYLKYEKCSLAVGGTQARVCIFKTIHLDLADVQQLWVDAQANKPRAVVNRASADVMRDHRCIYSKQTSFATVGPVVAPGSEQEPRKPRWTRRVEHGGREQSRSCLERPTSTPPGLA